MAEEKSNLEPIDEGDLDLKAKFLGMAKPKNPESVIAEVKEEIVPMPKKNIKEAEEASNLEPIGNGDLDLKAKFTGAVPPKISQEAPQSPVFPKEKYDFPKMAIAKKAEPVPSSSPVEEKNILPKERVPDIGQVKMAYIPSMEKSPEAVPDPEIAVEKEEKHFEKPESGEETSRMTISRHAVDKNIVDDARMTDRDKDVESKIETLVRLAELKGIPHAVKVAKHLDDNYTMDEFHDYLLTDELHEALVRRGLVEES